MITIAVISAGAAAYHWATKSRENSVIWLMIGAAFLSARFLP